jgi:hypothetical protein
VPQGSILGPLLFLLYINDLGDVSDKLSMILFADDSNLFVEGNNLIEAANSLNLELPKLVDWPRANRLSLNIKKTNYMVFGMKKKAVPPDMNIIIEDEIINRVEHTKFLGITLDTDLTWKPHIAQITKKIAKSVGVLTLARQSLDRTTLTQLYYSFIDPYLLYCNLIWGKATATNIWPIFKLKKRALRIIYNIPRRDSTLIYFHKANILRLPDINTYISGIFMYQFTNDNLPGIFDCFFAKNQQFHHYQTRSANNIRPPRIITNLATKFIKTAGVSIWNKLTNCIPTDTSISIFKRNLKSYLHQKYIE